MTSGYLGSLDWLEQGPLSEWSHVVNDLDVGTIATAKAVLCF